MPTRIDTADVRRLGRQLVRARKATPLLLKRTVSSIRRAAKTEAKREAASVYNLTQSRIDRDVRVISGSLSVTIDGSRKPIIASSYKGTRQLKRKGLRVQPLIGKPATFLTRGFQHGKVTFQRQKGAARYPIAVVYGPSVADMLANKRVESSVSAKLTERAIRELSNRLARLEGR